MNHAKFKDAPVNTDLYYKNIELSTAITKKHKSKYKPEIVVSEYDVEDYVFRMFKVKDRLRKTRVQPVPQCNTIISMLLYMQHSWGCSRIADLLEKNHATIPHYFRTADFSTLERDKLLYPMVKRVFQDLNIKRRFIYGG